MRETGAKKPLLNIPSGVLRRTAPITTRPASCWSGQCGYWRKTGDRLGVASSLSQLGALRTVAGMPAAGVPLNTASYGIRRRLRPPEGAVGQVLNSLGRLRQLVGDGPLVAGQAGRGCIDFVDEQGQGAGNAGRVGRPEGDGDRGGGAGAG
jgi:hypothetical protein